MLKCKKVKCFFSLRQTPINHQNNLLMVSNSSITKQLLINGLGLNNELSEIIKGYVFYDQVGQVTKHRKEYLIREIKIVRFGMNEGITMLNHPLEFVHTRVRRWSYVRVWRSRPRPLLEYIMCSVCGNFYQTKRQLPLKASDIHTRFPYLSRIVCVCFFRFNTEQQYSSIQLSSHLRCDSEFDEDFNDSSSEDEDQDYIEEDEDQDQDYSEEDEDEDNNHHEP